MRTNPDFSMSALTPALLKLPAKLKWAMSVTSTFFFFSYIELRIPDHTPQVTLFLTIISVCFFFSGFLDSFFLPPLSALSALPAFPAFSALPFFSSSGSAFLGASSCFSSAVGSSWAINSLMLFGVHAVASPRIPMTKVSPRNRMPFLPSYFVSGILSVPLAQPRTCRCWRST